MPREIITVQVGQCGNQVGSRFWDMALREHSQALSRRPLYDEAMASFFQNVDGASELPLPYKESKGPQPIGRLRARCVLVDMEPAVINEARRGPLADLFSDRQVVSDVSGAGNNWAHGYHVYGPQYAEEIKDAIRYQAEQCDALQSFFVMFSLGGGTGSGLGSYICELLKDEYPDIYRFVSCVVPSEADSDDVVVSPYNAVLASRTLREDASCVLPVGNDALMNICSTIKEAKPDSKKGSAISDGPPQHKSCVAGDGQEKPFDQMNTIIARVLNSLTASMRFEGSLNVDLNEITTNLVPYPGMHFLLPALSPLTQPKDVRLQPRNVDQMFSDALSSSHQLLSCTPKQSVTMAIAFLLRGNISIHDVERNVQRVKPNVKMLPFNNDAFKVGLCQQAPIGQNFSVLALSNNCSVRQPFSDLKDRFMVLYKRKAHVHHYTQHGADPELFKIAKESLESLIHDYNHVDSTLEPPPSSQTPYLQGHDERVPVRSAYSPWVRQMCEPNAVESLQNWRPPRPII